MSPANAERVEQTPPEKYESQLGRTEPSEPAKAKIGEGSLNAFMRLGLAEVRQAVSLEGSVAQPTPYGMFGQVTPGEVAQAREPERGATVYGIENESSQDMSAGPTVHGAAEPGRSSPSDIAEDRGSTVHGERGITAGQSPAEISAINQPDHGFEHDLDRDRTR